ncbi:hypothetical protein [Halobellus rufus]|uniref:hypothetical protein n=1 Tax=Halobellus rufus TaxID=1448860 RepID=UPI000678831A|nr:hypothetical protein [Halobellus rufus]
MAADIDIPDPPDLTNRRSPSSLDEASLDSPSDLRREELEGLLRDGAWREAFAEWFEYTDLAAADVATLEEHGLFEQLDFYWDPFEDRLRFEVPQVPESLAGTDLEDVLGTELSDLGQAVIELLSEAYTEWDETGSPADSWQNDPVDDESPFEQ